MVVILFLVLKIKEKINCRWDFVSLGEVMLRFDPENDRIHNARSFRVWEGGGEYNVARSLSKVFRLDCAILTALADNQLGRLIEDLIWQGGVDSSEIIWRETDGISRKTRNGIYFIERGFGLRSPVGCSDRGNTAVSQLAPDDFDWNRIFTKKGVRWMHTGGIFAGLSESTAAVAKKAMREARDAGTIVSYDLNYRDSLWSERGGIEAANALNAELLPFADVVFGLEGFDSKLSSYNEDKFRKAAVALFRRFPNLKIAASTLRDVSSACSHSISAVCFANDTVYKANELRNIEVIDRVGSGDAFAGGFIYGALNDLSPEICLNYGAANSALTLTTIGDGSMATLAEVQKIAENKGLDLSR